MTLRSSGLRKLAWLAALFLLLQGVGAGQNTTLISLDQAIDLALAHNHALKATRTLILQNQAQEITANLRPNPTFGADSQFIPIFTPQDFSADELNQTQQFDIGVSYLFERGHKRQRRLQAARDQTAVTRAQVADAERSLAFDVGQQFVSVLLAESTLQFAQENLKDFQGTVDIAQAQFNAGAISEGDFLKIKLQLLQFQTDVSSARLAKVQALVGLRQLLGYDAAPANYDVVGDLAYQPLKGDPGGFPGPGDPRASRLSGRAAGRDRCPEPGPAGPGQRQGGRKRHLRLHSYRRAEFGFDLCQLRSAHFQPQSGRDRAHSLRPDPGRGNAAIGQRYGDVRCSQCVRGGAQQ